MSEKSRTPLWWQLVAFGFRLLYNEFAWTYDIVSWTVSLGHWRKWQRASIPHLLVDETQPVLELAHGTANLQIDLYAAQISTVALDLSPFMGRIAQRKLTRKGIPALLARASAFDLPFGSEVFSSIVSTFPTEFIVQPNTLSEAMRVLAPGGKLVFVPNGILKLTNPVARFLEWLYQITGQRGAWPIDPLEAFAGAGFQAKLLVEQLEGSEVTLIVATKPE